MKSSSLQDRALSLAGALLCASLGAGPWSAVHAADAVPQNAAPRVYSVAAGPLEAALNQYARQAGVMLSFEPALVRGRHSAGFTGFTTVQDGLDKLLEPHPLAARNAGGNSWLIQATPSKPAVPPLAPTRPAQPEVKLPEVLVTARRDPREAVFETPGSVAVVTRAEIDRLPPRNAADVLADVPGVYTSQSRLDPGVSVNIRGLQDFGRVNVMIDGTRQNYQQSGHGSNGTVYLDPELLGGVDIAKGPTSTVGGAGMIAGLVNFRTLEVQDLLKEGATLGGRVNATSGSNAYDFAGSAALGLRPNDDIDLVMVLSRKSVGDFEKGRRGSVADGLDNVVHGVTRLSSQDQDSALLKGTWRFAPGHAVKLSYIGLDARFGEDPQTASAGGIENHVRSDTLVGNYQWKPADSHWIDLKSSLYYTRTRNQAHRAEGGALDANAYALQYETSTIGGTLENTSRHALGPVTAVVKAGGEFYRDKTDPKAQSLSIGADAGTTALYTGSTPAGERTVASLFGEVALLHEDWLEVTGGLRYDWYGLQGDGRMRIGSILNPPGVRPGSTTLYTRFESDRHDGHFSPKLTMAVRPVESVQLFASIGRGMRPPGLTETLLWGQHTGSLFPYYPNPDLREERSRNWELGANLTRKSLFAPGDVARAKLAWFDSKVQNYITLARIMSPIDTEGGGIFGPYAYVNLDGAFRSRGLELQADYDTGRFFGTLNYTRILVDTGSGGYDPFPLGSLTGYPANTIGQPGDANIWHVIPSRKNLGLSGGMRLLDKRLVLGARMRYQSPSKNTSVWTQQGDTYNQRSWRLFDLWASYDITEDVVLRAAVNNLRDRNYAEMQGGGYFVGPGRTATVTLSVRF